MPTITDADKIGEGPLELYARAMANLISIDLAIDQAVTFPIEDARPARLLGSYFHGNVEVLDGSLIDELSQRASTPPYAAVMLANTDLIRYDSGNTIPTTVDLRIIMRLPTHRATDPTGIPQGRVMGALFERIYGNRYGLGATKLPHPDDMEEIPPLTGRRCITDGIIEGLSATPAEATPGEDRLRTDWRIRYQMRLSIDAEQRFGIVGLTGGG